MVIYFRFWVCGIWIIIRHVTFFLDLISFTLFFHFQLNAKICIILMITDLYCCCWYLLIFPEVLMTWYTWIFQLWDASTGQGFLEFTEHNERAWCVDFSRGDPTKFASGSDDRLVKLWSINEVLAFLSHNLWNVFFYTFPSFEFVLLSIKLLWISWIELTYDSLSWSRKTVCAPSEAMQMSAAFNFQLNLHISWLLALQITRHIVMIFGIPQFPGVYWLVMKKLLATRNSWMLKH